MFEPFAVVLYSVSVSIFIIACSIAIAILNIARTKTAKKHVLQHHEPVAAAADDDLVEQLQQFRRTSFAPNIGRAQPPDDAGPRLRPRLTDVVAIRPRAVSAPKQHEKLENTHRKTTLREQKKPNEPKE